MKLFERPTEEAATIIADVIEPVTRLAPTLAPIFAQSKDKNAVEAAASMLPVLLKDHRDDTFAVLAALTGRTVEEMSKQPFLATLRDLIALLDLDLTEGGDAVEAV